ncbi:hypothetical protein [Nonomuraea lactucae]|uniref:hypothetical protein n=1 Tax=Nonomuraea lactucae TaxID=2249762 RepID=UPI001964B83A|nr:hypothetical protein [Nonomuraea lactucae]
MPSKIGDMRRWTAARYGAAPWHLLALLACFAVAGYAAGRAAAAGILIGFLVWFVGAAIVHDLVLYPLYSLTDVAARRRPWHRGRARTGPAGRATNYVRVPAALSGLLLLMWFPLILGLSEDGYRRSTGLDTSPYLGRWLLVTGVLFAGSALAYVIRHRWKPYRDQRRESHGERHREQRARPR